ncbi:translocation and assembly module TamA [Gammaproteobacteria bacterium]
MNKYLANFGIVCHSLFFLTLLLSGVSHSADEESGEPQLRYQVKIEGVDNALKDYLQEISNAYARQNRTPANASVLRHRAEADLPTLHDALRARGHYDGQVDLKITEDGKFSTVIFAIEPGPLYRFGQCRVENLAAESAYRLPPARDLGLVVGQPAEAAQVLAAEANLLAGAKESGYALAQTGERVVTVDHDTQTMEVLLRLRPGPRAFLGDVAFSGKFKVDDGFLRSLAPWRLDTPYHPKLIEDLRQALIDTDLFASIRVSLGDSLDTRGRIPVHVELAERFQRTFKANLGYNVTKGPAISLGWWHRNYFGAGERLSLAGTLSGIGYSLETKYRQPNFYYPDQALVIDGGMAAENTNAYNTLTASISAGLEHKLAKNMTLTIGSTFRLSEVEDVAENANRFGLLSLPLKVDWDFSDNRLDAAHGGRLFFQGTPYAEILNTRLYFGKILGKYSHYLELLDHRRLVLAGRVSLGVILGAQRDSVPVDERFHAGGGGSIRGYGYQMASPLNAKGKPLGGVSLLELSTEARFEITQNFGGVLFIDGGGAFARDVPDSGDFLVGVGVGVRYATPIGPIRLDLGVPTEKREKFDDSFQIYLSIGQAF